MADPDETLRRERREKADVLLQKMVQVWREEGDQTVGFFIVTFTADLDGNDGMAWCHTQPAVLAYDNVQLALQKGVVQ